MALENFISKYGKKKEAKAILEGHMQDPNNPEVYNFAIARGQERNEDLPITDENGRVIQLPEVAIRQILQAYGVETHQEAINYAESNLESILTDLDEGKLFDLIFATKPHEQANYELAAQLHQDYVRLKSVVNAFQSDDDGEKHAALQELYAGAPDLIRQKLEEHNNSRDDSEKMSDEVMDMWSNALSYISLINPGYGLRLFGKEAEKKKESLRENLDTKQRLEEYVGGNIRNSEDENKLGSYEALYHLGQAA